MSSPIARYPIRLGFGFAAALKCLSLAMILIKPKLHIVEQKKTVRRSSRKIGMDFMDQSPEIISSAKPMRGDFPR